MSIKSKLGISYLIVGALVLSISAAFWVTTSKLNNIVGGHLDRTMEVYRVLTSIESASRSIVSSTKEFSLHYLISAPAAPETGGTGGEGHAAGQANVPPSQSAEGRELEQLNQSIAQYRAGVKRYGELIQIFPHEQVYFERILEEGKALILAGRGILHLTQTGASPGRVEEAIESFEKTGEQLGAAITAAIEHEREEIVEGQEEFHNTITLINVGHVIGLLIAGISIAGLGFVTSRSITRPITQLTEHTEKLVRGDFQTQINLNSRDELNTLAEAFNNLATELDTNHRLRSNAMGALYTSQNLLQTVFDSLPLAVFVKDRKGNMLMANNRLAKDLDLSMDEILGKNTSDLGFVDQAQLAVLIEQDRRVVETGEQVEIQEQAFTNRHGEARWWHIVKVPLMGEDGNVTSIVGIREDITERKLADEQLNAEVRQRKLAEERAKAEEKRLRSTLEASPVGTTIVLQDGTLVFANDRMGELWGVSMEEILGSKAKNFYRNPDDRAEIVEWLARGDRIRDHEIEMIHSDGTTVWALVSFEPTVHEEQDAFVTWVYDITERKATERALRRTQYAVEHAIDGMLWMRPEDGSVVYANQTICDSLGYEKEELQSLKASDFSATASPDQWKAFINELRRSNFVTHETEHYAQGGRVIPVEVTCSLADFEGEQFIVAFSRNITERREAERALKESEAELHAILDKSPIGAAIVEENGTLKFFNDRWMEMLGVDRETLTGARARDFYADPEERDVVGERFRKEGHVRDVEMRMKRADGSEFWAMLSLEPAGEQEDGTFYGWIYDITQMKQAEHAMQQAEALLMDAIESLPISFALWDADDRLILHNETALKFFPEQGAYLKLGGTFRDMIQTAFDKGLVVYEPDQHETWVEERYRQFKQSDSFEQSFSDGRTFFSSYRPTSAGGRVNVRLDITMRQRAEEAARLAEVALREAIESIPEGFVIFDSNDRLVIANKEYESMYAGEDGEILESGTSFEEILEAVRLRRGLSVEWKESRLKEHLDATGEPFFWELSGGRSLQVTEKRTESGGIVGIRTDVTEIFKARAEAEHAAHAKSSFLAAMSHEIRTPMNGVVGMIDLLQQTQLDKDQRQMMRTVRDSAFGLLQIIDDILDFSKIEAGKLGLESIPLSIQDILDSVAETLVTNADKNNIRLQVHVDPDVPDWVLGDPVRLRQVLFNLAGNAIKFTESTEQSRGVVILMAERIDSRSKKKAQMRISVSDTGIGMSQDTIDGLFVPFSQAETSTTRRFGGTGLGLSICNHLVELMEGTIEVESSEGSGSTFTINLPSQITDSPRASLAEADLSSLRILALLGYGEVKKTLPHYLKHYRADVEVIGEPEQVALRLTAALKREEPIDILIIGSAWGQRLRDELRAELRCDPAFSALRYVMLTEIRMEKKGMIPPDSFIVGNAPLRRSTLVRGIAVLAGLASPELDEGTPDMKQRLPPPTIEEAEARGDLILVAEDNVTNQDVIRRQLNLLGYAAEIAEDGMAAIIAWRTKRYGVVLTDCHMPILDGFELTAAIRREEIFKGTRIPIIAITANALQGEAQRCLESGMDDYLAKPLEMEKLKDMLAQWLPHVERKETIIQRSQADTELATDEEEPDTALSELKQTQESEGATDHAADAPIDPSALKSVFGDDPSTFREILNDFIQPATDNVKEIQDAYAGRIAKSVGTAAHKLKSSARTVGAHKLADICINLEAAGKAEDWEEIDASYPQLGRCLEEVTTYIIGL